MLPGAAATEAEVEAQESDLVRAVLQGSDT